MKKQYTKPQIESIEMEMLALLCLSTSDKPASGEPAGTNMQRRGDWADYEN